MKIGILVSLFIFLCGCGFGHEPPEGYIDECYGGNWSKNMVGKSPSYSVVLDLHVSEWNQLKLILKKFSKTENLRFFEDIRLTKSLNMFSVSLCSKEGIWIHADKRIWTVADSPEHIPLPLMINIQIYKNASKWSSISEDLNGLLLKEWPSELNIEHSYKSSYKNSLY